MEIPKQKELAEVNIELTHEDFGVICGLDSDDDFNDFLWGLRVNSQGVWAPDLSGRGGIATKGDLEAIRSPYGCHKPILPFPCAPAAFRGFLKWAQAEDDYLEELEAFVSRRTDEIADLVACFEACKGSDFQSPQTHETDENACARMKQANMSDRDIAQELKRVYPKLTPSRIGRLITAVPGITVTTDAYRKRGIRLLK